MSDKKGSEDRARFAGFESIPLDVTVKIGRARCRLRELSELRAGHVIRLDRRIGDRFELCSGEVLLARVEPVTCGDGMAVKVVEIPEGDDDRSL